MYNLNPPTTKNNLFTVYLFSCFFMLLIFIMSNHSLKNNLIHQKRKWDLDDDLNKEIEFYTQTKLLLQENNQTLLEYDCLIQNTNSFNKALNNTYQISKANTETKQAVFKAFNIYTQANKITSVYQPPKYIKKQNCDLDFDKDKYSVKHDDALLCCDSGYFWTGTCKDTPDGFEYVTNTGDYGGILQGAGYDHILACGKLSQEFKLTPNFFVVSIQHDRRIPYHTEVLTTYRSTLNVEILFDQQRQLDEISTPVGLEEDEFNRWLLNKTQAKLNHASSLFSDKNSSFYMKQKQHHHDTFIPPLNKKIDLSDQKIMMLRENITAEKAIIKELQAQTNSSFLKGVPAILIGSLFTTMIYSICMRSRQQQQQYQKLPLNNTEKTNYGTTSRSTCSDYP